MGQTGRHIITPKCHHFIQRRGHPKAGRIAMCQEKREGKRTHTGVGAHGLPAARQRVCPGFPGTDWEPRNNSEQRLKLQKPSGTTVPRPVRRVLPWKWGSKLWSWPVPTRKTLSGRTPQGVAMDSIWDMRWKKGRGDFQGKQKDSCPITNMGDRLGKVMAEERCNENQFQ